MDNNPQLQIQVVQAGDASKPAKNGDALQMHYEGTLDDGSVFDSSYTRGKTFNFTLGAGMVIAGWDQGLLGMCKGEVRNLIIPSHLGYGPRGFPPVIPANATLRFKVELVDLQSPGQ